MRHVSVLLSIVLAGLPAVALAAANDGSARDQLQELRGEARQIRSAALYVERLSSEPGTTWAQMDKQWNEIKPVQEAMTEHLDRLQAMEKSLTSAEQHALNGVRPNVEDIAARTHELRAMLDRNGVNIQSPEFKGLASHMAREASAVAHAADLNVTRTASR